MDFLIDMALSVLFSTLKQVVKNPEKKAALKKAMLKLRTQIDIAFAGDEDFSRELKPRNEARPDD